jgi:hypothetical protein
MQIVIDIPENVYYDTFQYVESLESSDFELLMMRAVKNGTPLPKGHGRLIDETDLKTLFELDDRLWWSNAVEEFTNLPTIIDADKESEGKEDEDTINNT